eukprot:CAMPEP_0115888066 /NCGR_PEP_ID=MMETSP0287-20121206/32110_1 /TAXON_ID=412157 /ORGANISM="Chrysochromulina rotalis, Strain UIO044" /LENGTH=98 /DNA_ID=CAMNT_0003344727 /DNA_START=370 /DNA_END=666 /DNA_ORIENTATION=+
MTLACGRWRQKEAVVGFIHRYIPRHDARVATRDVERATCAKAQGTHSIANVRTERVQQHVTFQIPQAYGAVAGASAEHFASCRLDAQRPQRLERRDTA